MSSLELHWVKREHLWVWNWKKKRTDHIIGKDYSWIFHCSVLCFFFLFVYLWICVEHLFMHWYVKHYIFLMVIVSYCNTVFWFYHSLIYPYNDISWEFIYNRVMLHWFLVIRFRVKLEWSLCSVSKLLVKKGYWQLVIFLIACNYTMCFHTNSCWQPVIDLQRLSGDIWLETPVIPTVEICWCLGVHVSNQPSEWGLGYLFLLTEIKVLPITMHPSALLSRRMPNTVYIAVHVLNLPLTF